MHSFVLFRLKENSLPDCKTLAFICRERANVPGFFRAMTSVDLHVYYFNDEYYMLAASGYYDQLPAFQPEMHVA